MPWKDYRDGSRVKWGSDQEQALSREQITLGAILRIADAVEKMAERHTELIRQRDRFEHDVGVLRDRLLRAERRNAALKGHLTRARRKAAT